MKKHSVHEMCRVAIIAAVYVALTMVNPISWGTMQFFNMMKCMAPGEFIPGAFSA